MKRKLAILTIVLALLAGVNAYFMLRKPQPPAGEQELTTFSDPVFNSAHAYVLPISEPSYIPILNSSAERPTIDAESAIVYDVRAGRLLFSKNPNAQLPIASLTKILSAVVVIENLQLDDIVTVSEEVIRVDREKQDLFAGEQITVAGLLKIMLVGSSNDAAYALAAHAKTKGLDFVARMNEKAAALRMSNSQFIDPAGLSDNGYSSAQDLIKLVRYSLRYDAIWNVLTEKELTISSADGKIIHTIKNTDQLLGIIPDIVGGKTGYTEGALGCLILLVNIPEKNDMIVSIVLKSRDRFGDTKKLVEWTRQAYRWE